MFGANPKRKPIISNGTRLAVQEIFTTIQGEGPLSGTPAVFIRLGGCNLACSFCDTEFESFQEVDLSEIISAVLEKTDHQQLVVITGGEPMRQNIVPLCKALLEHNYQVQIETNGTLYLPLPAAVEIVCSPKATKQGYSTIRADVLERITAFKFLVSATESPYQTIPNVGQNNNQPVYLQPLDMKNTKDNQQNLQHAITLCNAHNAKLSLQTHKIIGLP